MSGKNGGIPQIYNIIGGRDCYSVSGEWFHIFKAGSDKTVLCAAPRSTMKNVEEARDEAAKDLPEWQNVSPETMKIFLSEIIAAVCDGGVVLANAAADESGLDEREIFEEIKKMELLPPFAADYKIGNPALGGNLKVMTVGGAFEIKPSFYPTVIFSVLYELLNRSAVILISSKANVFCYYLGEIVSNAAKKADLPAGIFGLIHAHDGKLADDVLKEMITGKLYKIGNGIVVPKRK